MFPMRREEERGEYPYATDPSLSGHGDGERKKLRDTFHPPSYRIINKINRWGR